MERKQVELIQKKSKCLLLKKHTHKLSHICRKWSLLTSPQVYLFVYQLSRIDLEN